MKIFTYRRAILLLLMFCASVVQAQQLKLGASPTVIEKSALLDLNSDKQGLLLPRVNDYTLSPLNTAPDGMLIYSVTDKLLYIRKSGTWKKLVDETTAITSINGQTGPAVNLTTNNISESVNLYYTDARARAAFSAGTGINITGAGVVSALNSSALWNASQLQSRAISDAAPANNDVLTWDAVSSTWMPKINPAANNWLITGNTGVNPSTQFLGNKDNVKMVIKSDDTTFLEFGRRGQLGLTQGYPDYMDATEKVTYIRSALQFEVPPTVSFYPPKMWTTPDGNFRMKGPSAGTDDFEFGATGAANSNNGGFEFIIGDDGDEPIVFKNYFYATGAFTEIMRLQGDKVGIGMAGATPVRNLDVRGNMRVTGSAGTPNNILGRDNTTGDISNLSYDPYTLNITSGNLKVNNTSALWNANKLQGVDIATTAPTSGQVLTYNGTNWAPATASGGSGTGWALTGNSGTTAGTNFIGTTDSKALVVKTNNTEAMRVTTAQQVGINTTTPNSTLNVAGSVSANVFVSTSSAETSITADASMFLIYVMRTGSGANQDVTINLPQASTCKGRMYMIARSYSGVNGFVAAKPYGSEKINGASMIKMWDILPLMVISTGIDWQAFYGTQSYSTN